MLGLLVESFAQEVFKGGKKTVEVIPGNHVARAFRRRQANRRQQGTYFGAIFVLDDPALACTHQQGGHLDVGEILVDIDAVELFKRLNDGGLKAGV